MFESVDVGPAAAFCSVFSFNRHLATRKTPVARPLPDLNGHAVMSFFFCFLCVDFLVVYMGGSRGRVRAGGRRADRRRVFFVCIINRYPSICIALSPPLRLNGSTSLLLWRVFVFLFFAVKIQGSRRRV